MNLPLDRILNDKCIDWDLLKGSSILITGGTGLVGSVITRSLLYANDTNGADIKITLIVRDPAKAEALFGEDSARLDLIQADLGRDDHFEGSFDYIIHCASVTSSAMMVSSPVETLDISYRGTYAMLDLAARCNVRGMVYISSMEAYGVTPEEMNPITENKLGFVDLSNVRSSYQEGKRVCEFLCTSFAHEYGVHVCSARLAQTFGFGVPPKETRVFAQFARSIKEESDIVLHTKGDSTGNYCDTSDMVSAVLCLLTKGRPGDTYNVANEENSCRINEMAALCAQKIAGGNIKVVYDIPESNTFGYAPATGMRLSSAKMRKLGWTPMFSLEEMYEHLLAYWNGLD